MKDARIEYADIFDKPHHVPKKRAPMSLTDRAAQFAPFSALTGYEDLIAESARWTETQAELDESEIERLAHRRKSPGSCRMNGSRAEPIAPSGGPYGDMMPWRGPSFWTVGRRFPSAPFPASSPTPSTGRAWVKTVSNRGTVQDSPAILSDDQLAESSKYGAGNGAPSR